MLKILDTTPNLTYYISSNNYNIIYYLKQTTLKYKIGVLLNPNELNYIDVDFYIFPTEMLNYSIIKQQLDIKKEVMIISYNNKDIITINNFFKSISNTNLPLIINNLYLITN